MQPHHRRRVHRLSSLGGGLLLCVSSPALGQHIRGTVVDSASHAPLSGASVSLVRTNGVVVAHATSDARGDFQFAAQDSGSRLVVMRIGYYPRTTAVDVQHRDVVALQEAPRALDTVRTIDKVRCPEDSESIRALGIWQRARAALLHDQARLDASPAEFTIDQFSRVLPQLRAGTPSARRIPAIISQSIDVIHGTGAEPFASGRSPDEIVRRGLTDSATGHVLPPDVPLLLSDGFTASHCFAFAGTHLANDSLEGIAFVPTRDRDSLVDISGTLWIDSTRGVLQRLDFSYVSGQIAADTSWGGSLMFATAANGLSIVSAWTFRVPSARRPVTFAGGAGGPKYYVVLTRAVDGGEVADARWPDGTQWNAHLRSIAGQVLDAQSSRPRLGVSVSLLNAGLTTRTDSGGRFVFSDLLPGPYTLAITDTLTVLFGRIAGLHDPMFSGLKSPSEPLDPATHEKQWLDPLIALLTLEPGDSAVVQVRLPSIEAALRDKCHADSRGDSTTVIALWAPPVGVSQTTTRVEAQWESSTGPVRRSVAIDARGVAYVCGAPRGRQVRVQSDDAQGARAAVSITPRRPVTLVLLRQ